MTAPSTELPVPVDGDPLLDRLQGELLQNLPELLDEVATQLRDGWPDYAQFMVEQHSDVLDTAIQAVPGLVASAIASLRDPTSGPREEPEVPASMFEEIGAAQWRHGRQLTDLLSAYHVGARTAWHFVADTALAINVSHRAITALADAVFVFADQMSAATTRGYLREQSEAQVSRERRRDELAELLLSDRATTALVEAAALRAGWQLPREAAVVLVPRDSPSAVQASVRFDGTWLEVRQGELVGAIVPDPRSPLARRRLTAQLSGLGAVVGRPVPLDELPNSVRIAGIALRLRAAGVLDADPLFVGDHLDKIIVHQDSTLLIELREQCLAALESCQPATRERLEQTLAAWLRHHRDRRRVAEELHVHPQTVRYRVGQLRELFGDALDDPDMVAKLTLALVWGGPSAAP
jgi:PucR C-terminal helix-turn-helix domain